MDFWSFNYLSAILTNLVHTVQHRKLKYYNDKNVQYYLRWKKHCYHQRKFYITHNKEHIP